MVILPTRGEFEVLHRVCLKKAVCLLYFLGHKIAGRRQQIGSLMEVAALIVSYGLLFGVICWKMHLHVLLAERAESWGFPGSEIPSKRAGR